MKHQDNPLRLFCRAAALSVKFNGSVYYAYDAEHGKYGKQIEQLHNLGLSVIFQISDAR